MRQKQVVSTIYSPQLGNTAKTNHIKIRQLIQRYAQSSLFRKGSVTSFSTIFCV